MYDPDHLDNRDPAAIAKAARFLQRTVLRWHPHTVTGVDRIPHGPVLYVGNHSAGMYTPDSYLFFHAVFRARGVHALPHGLAHETVLRLPPVNRLLCPLGVVRANRENALRVFAAGRSALVYPGGDVDAVRPFRKRDTVVFDGRLGYVRLALEAGVPIVPVATAGAHASMFIIDDMRWLAKLLRFDKYFRMKAWPLVLSFPLGLTLGPTAFFVPFPSKIDIEALAPVYFDRSGPEAAADDAYVAACGARVLGALQRAVTRLADGRRRPVQRPRRPGSGIS